ncbi:MAG: molybdenum cofactor guanylyltransferase MobA [Paracoccaceae bacterium]
MRVFGIILTGGRGLRMGGVDKALIELGGTSLVARVMARLAPQVEQLAVAGPRGYLGVPCLPDEVAMGPLSGVLAGLRWARDAGADAVVTVPVDGPFLPLDLVGRLAARGGVALAESGGRVHPTFALWPVGVLAALEGFLTSGAKPKVLDFADAQGALRVEFADDRAFVNLNTPEDLARAQVVIGAGS